MKADDLARQIVRFQAARPHACRWSGEEIREQAGCWAGKIGWLTRENLAVVFTELIGEGRLDMAKMVKLAREIQPYTGGRRPVVEDAIPAAGTEDYRRGTVRVTALRIIVAAGQQWCAGETESAVMVLYRDREMPPREMDDLRRHFSRWRENRASGTG